MELEFGLGDRVLIVDGPGLVGTRGEIVSCTIRSSDVQIYEIKYGRNWLILGDYCARLARHLTKA